MAQTKFLLLFLTVALQVALYPVFSFNLWKNGSIYLDGPASSKFGYSVALWADGLTSKRIVVGAPLGDEHPDLGDASKHKLGNVFLCDLQGKCNEHEGMPFVNTKESRDALSAGFSMKKYGMGFGETITTLKQSSSPLAVCAPRFPMKIDGSVQARGACYILKNTESDATIMVPNARKRPKLKTYQNALMGFSAAFSQINETVPSIVIGGPLAYYGEGMIINNPIEGRNRGYPNRLSNINPPEKGANNANEGWRVAQGKFDGNQIYIVSSAINWGSNTGKVKFYPKKIERMEVNQRNFLKEINGFDVGSKFGYSLGVGDFNDDGVDDLLVGSPWSSVKEPRKLSDAGKVYVYYSPLLEDQDPQVIPGLDEWGEFGTCLTSVGDINRDGYDDMAVAAPFGGLDKSGVVYVFNGSPEGILDKATQVLRASDFPQAFRGFGFSLDGGIDMDGNGYPDIVIGAVESDKALLLRSASVVTLEGSVSFKTEALSVDDKSCDLESAGYKTIKGVCFYLDIYLLYKSPDLTEDIDVELHMELLDMSDKPQFVFKVTNDRRYTKKITVRNIQKRSVKIGEVIFAKSDRSVIGQPVKVSVKVGLLPASSNGTARVAGDSNLPPIPPVLDALSLTTFNTSVILTCENNKTCFSKPDMAISANRTTLIIGGENIGFPVLLEVRNDPAYEVEVTINHPSALKFHRVEGEGLIPECLCKRLVGITFCTKLICKFTFVEADAKVPFTLFFAHKASDVMKLIEESSKNHITINLNVHSDSDDTDERDNTFDSEIRVKTDAKLYTTGESIPETTAVKVNASLSQAEIEAIMNSNGKHKVSPARLGPKITQRFSLNNRGPSPVKGAKLDLTLALYYGDNKTKLIYLLDEPFTSKGITCRWPPADPWNLKGRGPNSSPYLNTSNSATHSEGTTSRRRRQIQENNELGSSRIEERSSKRWVSSYEYVAPLEEEPQPRAARSFATPEGTRYIDCHSLQDCRVTCDVDLLDVDDQVSVAISGNLVIATLDQHGHNKLGVRSWATARMNQKGVTLINPKSAATTFVTLLKPAETGLSAVPFWLLLVAILGAIVLILIIMALLWRAGFFKRKRPPVYSATRVKEGKEMTALQTDMS